MNNPFTLITPFLTMALNALGLDQITDFTLELDQWICHLTFKRAYVVLIDWDRTGNWEVCAFSHIPTDMDGFFQHTLYFNSTFEASESLPSLLSTLATLGIEPLGHEIHSDDGPCIELCTASPLDMTTQMTLAQLPSPNQAFDMPCFMSYEQYQAWRKVPEQTEHATEIKREDGTTLVFVDDPTEGRYIALFDQSGKNLQHINLDSNELDQLKSWINGIDTNGHDLEPDLTDEEAYCDDHAYDQDTDIPVIRNWNDQRSLSEQELMERDQGEPSEEERIEARAQHWQERKAIEADYIQLYP